VLMLRQASSFEGRALVSAVTAAGAEDIGEAAP
jgi:hypothetical protein